MERFRIDNAYGVVYEYDENSGAYVFCGKFHGFGITPDMDKSEQLRLIEQLYYDEE